jgi:hypothetical protein
VNENGEKTNEMKIGQKSAIREDSFSSSYLWCVFGEKEIEKEEERSL